METEFALKAQEELRNTPPVRSDAEARFLSELTLLSQKYRLGIAGSVFVFLMEWDDSERVYSCDSESRLFFR